MARVYRARQTAFDRDVALKVIPRSNSDDPLETTRRFEREKLIFGQLNHPHILPVYEAGSTDECLFYSMRLAESGTLEDHLLKHQRLNNQQLQALVSQIGGALAFAHQNGIVHRDIKASNILLDHDFHLFLADFGLARHCQQLTMLTAQGSLVGTPAYLAPEQLRGEQATPQSDVYAFGILFYQALTGKLPFDGEIFAILQMHLNAIPEPPSRVLDTHLDLFDAPLSRALAKDPKDRFLSMDDFMKALQAALKEDRQSLKAIMAPLSTPVPVPVPESNSGLSRRSVLLGGLALIGGSAAASLWSRNPRRDFSWPITLETLGPVQPEGPLAGQLVGHRLAAVFKHGDSQGLGVLEILDKGKPVEWFCPGQGLQISKTNQGLLVCSDSFFPDRKQQGLMLAQATNKTLYYPDEAIFTEFDRVSHASSSLSRRRLYFQASKGNSAGRIYVLDRLRSWERSETDKQGLRLHTAASSAIAPVLTDPAQPGEWQQWPSVCPTRPCVVFSRGLDDRNYSLWTFDFEDTTQGPLGQASNIQPLDWEEPEGIQKGAGDQKASWSPDGSRLVFQRTYRNDPLETQLFILDIAQKRIQMISKVGAHSCPSWAPSNYISFISDGNIVVLDPEKPVDPGNPARSYTVVWRARKTEDGWVSASQVAWLPPHQNDN